MAATKKKKATASPAIATLMRKWFDVSLKEAKQLSQRYIVAQAYHRVVELHKPPYRKDRFLAQLDGLAWEAATAYIQTSTGFNCETGTMLNGSIMETDEYEHFDNLGEILRFTVVTIDKTSPVIQMDKEQLLHTNKDLWCFTKGQIEEVFKIISTIWEVKVNVKST